MNKRLKQITNICLASIMLLSVGDYASTIISSPNHVTFAYSRNDLRRLNKAIRKNANKFKWARSDYIDNVNLITKYNKNINKDRRILRHDHNSKTRHRVIRNIRLMHYYINGNKKEMRHNLNKTKFYIKRNKILYHKLTMAQLAHPTKRHHNRRVRIHHRRRHLSELQQRERNADLNEARAKKAQQEEQASLNQRVLNADKNERTVREHEYQKYQKLEPIYGPMARDFVDDPNAPEFNNELENLPKVNEYNDIDNGHDVGAYVAENPTKTSRDLYYIKFYGDPDNSEYHEGLVNGEDNFTNNENQHPVEDILNGGDNSSSRYLRAKDDVDNFFDKLFNNHRVDNINNNY